MDIYIIDDSPERIIEIQRIFLASLFNLYSFDSFAGMKESLMKKVPSLILVNSISDQNENTILLEYLEENLDENPVPVLNYCNSDDIEMINRIYDSGAVDYLRYPFIPSELIHKTNTWAANINAQDINRKWLDQIRTISNDGLFAWNITTNESIFDSTYYKMAGYEPGEFPSHFTEWKKRVHPDDYPETQVKAGIYLKGELPDSSDLFRFRKKDGSWMWIQSSIKFVQRDREGKILRLVGTHRNVDKEVKQEALLKAQNRISATASTTEDEDTLIENYLNEIVALSNSHAGFIYRRGDLASPLLLKCSGDHSCPDKNIIPYIKSSMESQSESIFNDIDNDPQYKANLFCLPLEIDKDYSIVLCLCRDDYRFYEEETQQFKDLSAFFVDHLQRKQAEKQVLEIQKYLKDLIDSMPLGVIGLSIDDSIIFMNKAAGSMIGSALEESTGKSIFAIFPPAAELKQDIEKCRSAIDIIQNKLILNAEDDKKILEVMMYPLVHPKGCDIIFLINDITEKTAISELLIQSEKMMSVGGLAAGMAHELNNPLAGIIQTAYVISSRLFGSENSPANLEAAGEIGIRMDQIVSFMEKREIPRLFKYIDTSGQRMADIINNMLSFARTGDSGKTTTPASELIHDSINLVSTDFNLKKKYDIKNIAFNISIDEHLPLIPCEKSKIQQVIINIVQNAAQAMSNSSIEAPEISINATYNAKKKKAVIIIEDNGPGMSDSVRRRIFEPFFTTKKLGEGTGLGLSIAYFIITENHNGELFVESTEGVGTKFTIVLPVL